MSVRFGQTKGQTIQSRLKPLAIYAILEMAAEREEINKSRVPTGCENTRASRLTKQRDF